MKEHRFTLVVKTTGTRKEAKLAVLSAFAARQPDSCDFHLSDTLKDKKVWMEGAKAGTQIAFQLIRKSIEQLQQKCLPATQPERRMNDE